MCLQWSKEVKLVLERKTSKTCVKFSRQTFDLSLLDVTRCFRDVVTTGDTFRSIQMADRQTIHLILEGS